MAYSHLDSAVATLVSHYPSYSTAGVVNLLKIKPWESEMQGRREHIHVHCKKQKPNRKYANLRLKVKLLAEKKKKVRLKVKRFAEKKYARLNQLAQKKNKWRKLVRCYHMVEFEQGCNIHYRGGGHVMSQFLSEFTKERARYMTTMNPLQVPSTLERYESMLIDYFKEGNLLQISIPRQLFHYDHHFNIPIGKDEIERWLDQDEIEACHVSVYIKYLAENHCAGAGDMFGFLCPNRISPGYDGGSIEDRAKYVASAMEGNINNKIFFGPYNPGGHWVLIVFNPQFDYAYWIDPLHGDIREDAMRLVAMSHTIKFAELGGRKPRPRTLWHRIKCPLQNMVDCGYYVVRFMREIIKQRCVHIPLSWYDHKTTYTQQDIDEIRTEWMDFVFGLSLRRAHLL